MTCTLKWPSLYFSSSTGYWESLGLSLGTLYFFSSSTFCIDLSALIWGAFLGKNWSTLWLVFAITSVALGLPLLLPVGAFFLVGVWTRDAKFLAVKLAS